MRAETGQGAANGQASRNAATGATRGDRAGAAVASASPAPVGGRTDDDARFDRLTKRHRECLQGVCGLKGSKEIADALGIEKSTVDSYLTEAVKLIGARNRRDAALRWAEYEARASAVSSSEQTAFVAGSTPDKMGGHSARLSPPPAQPPMPVSPDEMIVGAPGDTGEAVVRPSSPGNRLPFRRKGQRGNDLTVGDRLIWIQAIALGIAIGFGMLMTGLQVLTGLIEALTRHLF